MKLRDPRDLLNRTETHAEKINRIDKALGVLYENREIREYTLEEIAEFCGMNFVSIFNMQSKIYQKLKHQNV